MAALFFTPAHGWTAEKDQKLPILTQVEQIRRLTPAEVARGYPAVLRGVVTYYDPIWEILTVQDSTGGIYVDLPKSKSPLRAGDRVEISGLAVPSEFAPAVTSPRIRCLGKAPMPPPRRPDIRQLAAGAESGQWIEVQGIVRSTAVEDAHLVLDVALFGLDLKVEIPQFPGSRYRQFVDAEVRVRGVAGTFYNNKGQLNGIQLFVPDIDHVQIERPAPADPFAAPVQPIRSLLRFTGRRASGHRERVQGFVTLQRPGESLFITDGTGGLNVQTNQPTALELGDRVEALGFPVPGDYTPVLQNAVFRRISSGAPPKAVSVKAEDALKGSFDAERVELNARLLGRVRRTGLQVLILQAGNLVFNAELKEAGSAHREIAAADGSLVRITGVCSVDTDTFRKPRSFQILLGSPDDVILLENPPWWTVRRALSTLAMVTAGVLAILVWVVVLRRRVREQTETIRRRLESEAALEQRFRYVARATNDAVWDRDLTTNQGWWGESFYTVFGYKPSEAEPDTAWWADHIHPQDRDRVVSSMNASIESNEENWSGEYRCRRADGSYAFVYDRGYILRNESGKPLRMIGAMMDISALKRAEEALRESQARFTAFMDNSPTFAYMKDSEGRYVYANRGLETLMQSRLERKTSLDFLEADAAMKYRAHDLCVLASGRAAEIVETIPVADGTQRDLLVFKFPVEASGQVFLGGVAIDVTERKRAEAELRKAKEEAEAANRSKSEFVANVSHEVRTPMNGILGMIDLVLASDLLPEQREYLDMAKSSADALLTIINDILDFSKIEAGKFALEAIPFHLRASVERALKDLLLRARQKGLELDCRIHPETPQVVVGDPVRLRQILINLVGNAIKFTEHGAVAIQVEPQAGGLGDIWLHFRVSDTGIGIPAAKQDEIFDAFTQADGSTARRYGGTGLGLTICRRLVEMMRGRIWMESEVGRGTTIHVTACFGVGEAAAASPGVEQAAAPVPAVSAGRALDILLVEDNVVNQKLAVNLLAKQGHRVTLAKNGREALAAIERQRFELVLMDIQMPEMDGLEATRAVRARERGADHHLPIIAMTAHAMKGDCERCLEAGMDDYISKPIQTSTLFQAIERAAAICPPRAGLPVTEPAGN